MPKFIITESEFEFHIELIINDKEGEFKVVAKIPWGEETQGYDQAKAIAKSQVSELNEREEKFLTSAPITNLEVGDPYERRMDSSSPPAVWTEQYIITRIDNTGIYGVYLDTPDFYEFSGEDMR